MEERLFWIGIFMGAYVWATRTKIKKRLHKKR